MLKKVYGKKFSRNTNSRRAMFRSLMIALIINGKIETTKAKAKAIQGDVDSLMSLAGKGDLNAKRLVLSKLANDTDATEKLFSMKELVAKRKSGFTRIVNLPNRHGDNAPMARIEFV